MCPGEAAGAVGLLLGDVLRRTHSYPDDAPTLLTFVVLAILTVFVLTAVTLRQIIRTALLSVPCGVLAYLLVSSPWLALLVGVSR